MSTPTDAERQRAREAIDELLKALEASGFNAVPLPLLSGQEYILNENGEVVAIVTRVKKCECGADSLKSPKHAHYCPKYDQAVKNSP